VNGTGRGGRCDEEDVVFRRLSLIQINGNRVVDGIPGERFKIFLNNGQTREEIEVTALQDRKTNFFV